MSIEIELARIAAALEILANRPATIINHGAPVQHTPADEFAMRYEDLSREVLVSMCEERGIEIPKNTKTPTLIKKLNTHDLINSNKTVGPVPEPEQVKTEDSPVIEQPVVEDDPFAVAEQATPTGKISKEDVLAALQIVREKKGIDTVVAILSEHGGVTKLKDLAEDKYAAVMEAANG